MLLLSPIPSPWPAPSSSSSPCSSPGRNPSSSAAAPRRRLRLPQLKLRPSRAPSRHLPHPRRVARAETPPIAGIEPSSPTPAAAFRARIRRRLSSPAITEHTIAFVVSSWCSCTSLPFPSLSVGRRRREPSSAAAKRRQIGRASCRERVFRAV